MDASVELVKRLLPSVAHIHTEIPASYRNAFGVSGSEGKRRTLNFSIGGDDCGRNALASTWDVAGAVRSGKRSRESSCIALERVRDLSVNTCAGQAVSEQRCRDGCEGNSERGSEGNSRAQSHGRSTS